MAETTEATKKVDAQTKKAAETPALPSGPVAERVAKLRELSQTDSETAREEAWNWIAELGERARSDREGALADLQALFLCGRPAEGIEGQTEGILVTWTMHPLADKLVGTITNAWMPWLGKKFDLEQQTGLNTLTNSARWPAKILWPLYATREAPLGRSAFDFTTYTEAGRRRESRARPRGSSSHGRCTRWPTSWWARSPTPGCPGWERSSIWSSRRVSTP